MYFGWWSADVRGDSTVLKTNGAASVAALATVIAFVCDGSAKCRESAWFSFCSRKCIPISRNCQRTCPRRKTVAPPSTGNRSPRGTTPAPGPCQSFRFSCDNRPIRETEDDESPDRNGGFSRTKIRLWNIVRNLNLHKTVKKLNFLTASRKLYNSFSRKIAEKEKKHAKDVVSKN